MITKERIIELAKEHYLDIGMYPRAVLTDMGDGTMMFITPTKLTYYGEALVGFACAVAREAHDN